MPKLIIDGLEIEVPSGTKVIEAAERLGIVIPRFCYHEALGSVGACRMCAVKFLQGPFKGVQMSCMIDAQDGMVVSTQDEEAVLFRKRVIEWLMLNHPHDCPVCDEGGQCLLQDETVSGGHGVRRYPGRKRTYRDQFLGVFLAHEMNRCIHCYRCARFYQEFAGGRDLGTLCLGDRVYFGRFEDGQLESPFSGNLVDLCPTGVYTDRTARYRARRWDLQRAPSLCLHCSLGCNTIANARYRSVVRIEARYNARVNGHFICDRGRFGFSWANGEPGELERPREARAGGEPVSLDHAVVKITEALGAILDSAGPSAVACLGSGRSSLEVLESLKRFCAALGISGPDLFLTSSAARKVRRAVSLLKPHLACSLREIEEADSILVIGCDPLGEAPMLAYSLRQANRKGAPVTVLDPRPVELPFSFELISADPRDLNACLRFLSSGGSGEVPSEIRTSLERVVRELDGRHRPVIVCGTEMVEETAPELAAGLAEFLGGQADGARLFYVLPGPNAYAAGLFSETETGSFEETLGSIEKGIVKALVVVETDPMGFHPDRERVQRALDALDLLVVLDYLPSLTVDRADVFLPTSTVFEAGGHFVNQEGRVQFAHPTHRGGIPIRGEHPPRIFRDFVPGETRPAGEILGMLLERMGPPGGPDSGTPDRSPVRNAPAPVRDLPGLFSDLPPEGQRIFSAGDPAGSPAKVESRGSAPPLDGNFLLLPTDSTFGTEELSSYSPAIRSVAGGPAVFVHRADADRMGWREGDAVALDLAGGLIKVRVAPRDRMARRVLVLPRHWSLDWRKIRGGPLLIPESRIRKIRESAPL